MRCALSAMAVAAALAGCESETPLLRVPANGYFDPPELVFGTRRSGDTHELVTVLRNASSAQLRVVGVRFEPDADVYFPRLQGATLLNTVVAPGDRVEIVMAYAPRAEGDHDTTMILVLDDVQVELPIRGRARAVPPARPELNPSAVTFFGTEVGREVAQTVRVRNAGDVDGALAAVRNVAAPFSVTAPGGAPLGLPSPRIPPGETLEVEVRYRPSSPTATAREIELVFDSTQSAVLAVSGEAQPAGTLACDTTRVDFGEVPRGSAEVRAVACVASGGPYHLSAVRLVPGSARVFRLRSAPGAVDGDGRLRVEVEMEGAGLPESHFGGLEIAAAHGEVVRVALAGRTVPPAPGSSDVRAVLTWDTGYTDLDLHLVRSAAPPFSPGDDCFFMDKNPDWGQPQETRDDPFLDRDDVDGFGPEEINLGLAAEQQYDVYVQYFAYQGASGPPTSATVTLQLRGGAPVTLQQAIGRCGDTWHVGRIFFSGGAPRVEVVSRVEATWRPWASAACR